MAAETIRRHDPSGSIVILSAENELPYTRHLLPELLSGEKKERSLFLNPKSFFAKSRILFRGGERVEDIELERSTISTRSAKYHFDRLLIATGSRPLLPRLSLLNVYGVFVLRSLADYRSMEAYFRQERVRSAAVVGSGVTGLKLAHALHKRGVAVTIVEKESRLLPHVLDQDSLAPLSKQCWKNGLKILVQERFREFLTTGRNKRVSHLVTYSGRSFSCDAAIMCPGVSPNMALAKSVGLETRRGVVVDNFLRTSAENVFAAGDVIETRNAATGRNEVMPLWQNALDQGRLAGANMAGGHIRYDGAIWQYSMELFGLKLMTLGQSHLADNPPHTKVVSTPGLKDGTGIRLVFSGDRLIGVSLFGETKNGNAYRKVIMERLPVWLLREQLLSREFDLSRLYLRFHSTPEEGLLQYPGADSGHHTTPGS